MFKGSYCKSLSMVYNIVSVVVIFNMVKMSTSASLVSDTMANEKIVPDIIPVAPHEVLQLTYIPQLQVNLGGELMPYMVKQEPKVGWTTRPDVFYTLCMIDVDSPNPDNSTLREWQHWLVGNIPGTEIAKGDVLSKYIGAFPDFESGLHRYVFLVYQQPKKLNFDEPRLGDENMLGRSGFSIAKFAEKYDLGNPVAGNFFKAKWDDFALTLFEKLDYGNRVAARARNDTLSES